MKGKLVICATPIGNLEDITLRALRILGEVDLIAAEDTRETRKLLTHYKLKTQLTSYHSYNEKKKKKKIIEEIKKGKKVALVADRGMPGLSDPGYSLIKSCIEEGIELEVLPGPSAAISALAVSGLPSTSFIFLGFLPRKKGERKKILSKLKDEERTLIFYEAPHRIKQLIDEILEVLGNREAVLVRELTKVYEEILRGSVKEIKEKIQAKKPKGELTFLVKGEGKKASEKISSEEIYHLVQDLIAQGFSKKEAIKKVAQEKKVSKKFVYDIARGVRLNHR